MIAHVLSPDINELPLRMLSPCSVHTTPRSTPTSPRMIHTARMASSRPRTAAPTLRTSGGRRSHRFVAAGRWRGYIHEVLGLPDHVNACLFDLDGVLTDTARVHDAAWTET